MSDDRVSVKLRVTEKLCLTDLSNFQIYHASRVLVGLFYRDVVGCETQVPQVSQSVGNVGS